MAIPSPVIDDKPMTLARGVFGSSVFIALLLGIFFVLQPVAAADMAKYAMGWITHYFGWLYLSVGMAAFGFAMWMSFGRYGSVVLGDPGEKPEFAEMHWIAMMFTAGIGAGLVTWGFVEPLFYLQTPPLGLEPHSDIAFEYAHMYPMFHWGVVPWAFYAIPAVPIAYTLYVKKRPYLRMSESCDPVLPKTGRRYIKNAIDVLIILGLIGGTATSLGLGVPLVSAMVAELFGVENTNIVKFLILAVWIMLFGASTLRGLKRGIQLLADINMALAGLVMAFVLLVGPTIFILDITVNSLGLMLSNFFRSSTASDPITNSGFPEAWTIFYWAWWIAFTTLVGLFVGRISRGRTIKHVILGTMFWGSVGTVAFLAIMGGYALYLEQNDLMPLTQMLTDHDMNYVTAKVIASLPLGKITLTAFIILSVIFYATSLDSSAFVLASVCTNNIRAGQEPRLYLKITWICLIGLVTAGMVLAGQLETVKSLTVISSLPMIPILILMCVATVIWLRADSKS